MRNKIILKLGPYIYLLPIFIIGGVVIVYPLINGIVLSFTNYSLNIPLYDWNGIQNYIDLLKDRLFWEVFLNSIFIVFISVVLQLIGGLIFAILLNIDFPLKNVFRSIIFSIWILPLVVISFLWLTIYNSEYGLINAFIRDVAGVHDSSIFWLGEVWLAKLALIIVYAWRGIPFFMVMILAALQTIPKDLFDASKIDGASNVQRFFFITIPYIKHILILSALLSVVRLFQDITVIYVLTMGGPINATTTLSVYVYKTAFLGMQLGKAATIGVFWLLFLSIFAIFYTRMVMKRDNIN